MSAGIGSIVGNLPSPFGGFAPFPNSIMIPFMGYQSAVLGYQFGLNYEIGKRTVKAMPNDLFNKIVAGDNTPINVVYNGTEYSMTYAEYIDFITKQHANQQLTEFRNALPDAQSVMNDIINESVKIELKKAERTPSAMAEILQTLLAGSQGALTEFLDGLDDASKAILFQIFPLLGLMYQNAGTTDPTDPTDPPTDPTDPLEEYTSFTVSWIYPPTGETRTFQTEALTYYGHKAVWEQWAQDSNIHQNQWVAYRDTINEYYNVSSA